MSWHDEDGWDVIRVDDSEVLVWALSAVDFPGYRALAPGERVELEYERAEQDGYHYRATLVCRAGRE